MSALGVCTDFCEPCERVGGTPTFRHGREDIVTTATICMSGRPTLECDLPYCQQPLDLRKRTNLQVSDGSLTSKSEGKISRRLGVSCATRRIWRVLD